MKSKRDNYLEKLRIGQAVTHEVHRPAGIGRQRCHQRLLDALPVRQRARYRHPEMTLRLGIRCEEAWLAWCDDVTAELERE